MELTAEQRSMSARYAALSRWAQTPDRAAAMAPAWRGKMAAYERKVDPQGVLPPAMRATLALAAQRAHMTGLALKSSLARSKPAKGATPKTVCSWCHPKTAGRSHQTCARHARTFDAMVAYVRARHAGVIGNVA